MCNAGEALLEDGGFAALADAAHGVAIPSLTPQGAKSAGFCAKAQVSHNRVEVHHKRENDQCFCHDENAVALVILLSSSPTQSSPHASDFQLLKAHPV